MEKRIIKFKFWLGHTKKMTYEHSLIEIGNTAWDFTDDIIPLQYIGRTDKNGKEIYEGDIVRWDDESNGEYWRVAKVVINPDIQFVIVKNTLHELSTRFPDTFHFGSFIYTGNGQLEIVGNIYQHPELLTPLQ